MEKSREELKQEILDFIREKNEKTGYHNGYGRVHLLHHFDIPFEEMNSILNELYKEKKIYIMQGVNYKLLFATRNEKKIMYL